MWPTTHRPVTYGAPPEISMFHHQAATAAAAAAAAAAGENAWQTPSPPRSTVVVGYATCQDCGNQSKKDCSHNRCRTCCKSRGFHCATHVKSTWVSATIKKERSSQMLTGGGGSGGGFLGSKRPRLVKTQANSSTSTSNNTPPPSFDTGSTTSHQDVSFKEKLPGSVRAQASFKCIKVTAVEDGEDEFAYQAVVKIGGHVFKGVLYDKGVKPLDGLLNMSDLHLGGGGSSAGAVGGRVGVSILDPCGIYGASGGGGEGLLGGSGFGNSIN